MKNTNLVLTTLVSLFFSCSGGANDIEQGNTTSPPSQSPPQDIWLIEKSEVRDGGPGKDGIPALENPDMLFVERINYLDDSDLVLGMENKGEVIAFPHKILDWHEIINVDVLDHPVAIVYCPLTGTGIAWEREIQGEVTTFGVSGLLYRNNVIPYDRKTDSNWSQLKLQCVNGDLIGESPGSSSLIEVNWGTWKKMFPLSRVVSTDTGFDRQYDIYPYGGYKTNNQDFIFPIEPLKNNIPAKERVHMIIADQKIKVYRFQDFEEGHVIKDMFQGKEYLLVGNKDFMVSFELDAETASREFTYEYDEGEMVMKDDQLNSWSIFGEALSGPDKGSYLNNSHTSMMGYYFSVESFYKNPEIYMP
jgi:hypothetical protein